MVKNQLINFRENSYTVKFPTIGQLQDIESFKLMYTNGKYVDMMSSELKIHNFLLDVTDAVSYFAVLIPELKTDLEIKNWKEIPTDLSKELVKTYKKQFVPWFKPILDDLYKFEDEDGEAKEESTEG